MARMPKSIKNREIHKYPQMPVTAQDVMGKHIFKSFSEIQEHHPETIKKYYQNFLDDYQQDSRYDHTEKIDDLTFQRLHWLKEQKCGYYHDIISQAVLMAYTMYRDASRLRWETHQE